MRINSESDVARLREQLADQMTSSKVEIDNLRRALDDMKYKNEESVRQINLKNEEIESMMDQMENLTAVIEKREDNIVDLKQTIVDIEMKNRKMNDVLNKAIHGKTQANIDKTTNAFKKNPKMSGDPRMQALM
jgi:chromosome segregation ATPase